GRRRSRGDRVSEETQAPLAARRAESSPIVEPAELEVDVDVTPRKDIRDDRPAETASRRGRNRRAGLNPEVSLADESPRGEATEASLWEDEQDWEDEAPSPRPQPEKIIPPSPFAVIFQSPDLATDDDEIAPSAASERAQSRRRPQVRGQQRGPRRQG
ncbi:DEAD/DEAH box helicase, partial [Streptosporangium algeriense]